MGVIAPKRRPGRAYFGCGGAACLGLIIWVIIFCCLAVAVTGLSTELPAVNPEVHSMYYAFSQLMVGSLAFGFSMAAILVVFVGFGLFRQAHRFRARGEPNDLNTVTMSFYLFVAGMILAAALPTFVLEYPGTNAWIFAGGIGIGAAYLLYGMLRLWLTLAAYESYRHRENGDIA